MTGFEQIFEAFLQVVPYTFFEGVMALTIVFEVLYTFFETIDVL